MFELRNGVGAVLLATVLLGVAAPVGASWAGEKKPITQIINADTCKGSKVKTACLQGSAMTAYIKG